MVTWCDATHVAVMNVDVMFRHWGCNVTICSDVTCIIRPCNSVCVCVCVCGRANVTFVVNAAESED